ncbi:MAG TPA: GyrI-like domain-containing protein [Chitinophaga sp.]|uniref:GyrI-like domain-containing protein n=1 Tax=Chitinophaga sp. TaxID=1869181 RepID=UPI002CC71F3F|nr:GyrI-like domain-containing protein [Chitinophaga sp.]HVI46851.1 GyrI-like domain-containing protein [Chitinophaga sp.]
MKCFQYLGRVLLIALIIYNDQTLTQMTKLDLTKAYKNYYTATTTPQVVTIEKGSFITLTGKGDPDGAAFSETIGTLYTVAYSIKGICKQQSKDFIVSKLEGFWWVEDKHVDPLKVPRSEWCYELAIRMPDYVTHRHFAAAVVTAEKKKHSSLFREVNFKEIEEGPSVQLLHNGPFSEEPVSLKKMEELMKKDGLAMNGRHHEIYLSDHRKTQPEKLKTILRHPVKREG